MPQGWTRHNSEDENKVFYTPKATSKWKFKYPIPLRQTGARSENVQSSHLLRFQAKRGYLNVGSAIKSSPNDWDDDSEDRRIATLKDDSGKWAGVVHLHVLGSKKPTAFT